jgi:hypothetical protein
MLVEEQVLHAAIREKYKRLWEEGNLTVENPEPTPKAKMLERDVIRETLEKLFSAHLRLPALEKAEVRDLVYGFGTESVSAAEALRQQAADRDARILPTLRYIPGADAETRTSSPASAKPATTPPPEQTKVQRPVREKVTLTKDEKDALWDSLRDLAFKGQRVWGPRTVRALAFRFQLARLILDELSIEVGPKRLATLIVAATITPHAEVAESNRTVEAVVKQVT